MALSEESAKEIEDEVCRRIKIDKGIVSDLNKAYLAGKRDGVTEFFDMTIRDFIALIRREN